MLGASKRGSSIGEPIGWVHKLMTAIFSSLFIQRLSAVCCVAFTLVFCPQIHAQQFTVPQIAERLAVELKSQFGTTEQLNAAITRTYGIKLSPRNENVARSDLRELMFNEAVPTYIAKLLLPFYRPDITRGEIASAMVEGIAQMQARGMYRLSVMRQLDFVAHITAMSKGIPAPACKAMFLGRLDTKAASSLERRYIAGLPFEQFESISNLYKEAVQAELAGYPDARTINSNQAKLADTVYAVVVEKRLRANVPPLVLERFNKGSEDAPASDVCLVMYETTAAMLDMAEPYRSWQLTRFMQSMQ